MKTIIRWVGLWLMAGAFVAMVVDGIRWLANGTLALTPVGAAWFALDPASLNITQAAIERYTFPVLWDPVMITLLNLPIWAVAGGIGLLLALLGQKRVQPALSENALY